MSRPHGRSFLPLCDEGARLAARLVSCLPAATFEMETLSRLAGIVASRKVPTAAVECTYRPRLLVNPDFVAKYCQRDEHLFLLVMHELWHILLAHTRLYPRMTPAHNVAFDAVINSGLMRQFCQPEYRGFFEAINPPDKFPHLLLRPPLGWPSEPLYPDVGPPGTQQLLKRLYPSGNISIGPAPFYEELLNLLREYALENGLVDVMWVDGDPVLLGDHSGADHDPRTLSNPLLKDIMRHMVGAWPNGAFPTGGRGRGGTRDEILCELGLATEQARRVFSQVLRRCLGPKRGTLRRQARAPIPGISGISVLPNAHDRLAPARRRLGAPSTLWHQEGTIPARVPQDSGKAHVYFDVSGSMAQLIPHLLGLLLPYVSSGQVDLFQFSTMVEPLLVARVREGELDTTGGTDINCVLEHVLDFAPKTQRVLILTDGYTGLPWPDFASRVSAQNIRIHVVLPAESAYQDDLAGVAASFTVLPPVSTGRSPWNFDT